MPIYDDKFWVCSSVTQTLTNVLEGSSHHGSLIEFYETSLRAAEAEAASTPEHTSRNNIDPVRGSGNGPQLINPSGRYLGQLSWQRPWRKCIDLILMHGDVKPQNTVIDHEGRLLIIDVCCDLFSVGHAAPGLLLTRMSRSSR